MVVEFLILAIQDWANWFTIIALPLTLLGLIMTYKQGQKVKLSADAAKEAATTTAQKIECLESIDNLARHIQKLESCSTLLMHKEYGIVADILNQANSRLFVEMDVEQVELRRSYNLQRLHIQICDDIRNLRDKLREGNNDVETSVIEAHIDYLIKIFTLMSYKIKEKQK